MNKVMIILVIVGSALLLGGIVSSSYYQEASREISIQMMASTTSSTGDLADFNDAMSDMAWAGERIRHRVMLSQLLAIVGGILMVYSFLSLVITHDRKIRKINANNQVQAIGDKSPQPDP